ncbi:helicase-related protein, partial [Sandarakinorhabdus rubra]|uniref:helicase-related protein n=1 Tax=Sandarakinorhabdus rubra TaxID=2672568 RepID=UPI0022A6A1CA
MSNGPARVTAVLGPTNTGKTHLAVERLCGHASGIIGFPLRLLAREVYDRVVALKGPSEVALITGEEKIVPPGARWFLSTVESMPLDREVAFVAIDEGQMGADPERGHVFTDRLLNVRGYAETMILGSETLKPLVRKLLPEAEIITRPRFSTLAYAGAKKLSRLPRRTAIVAFTAAEVYAIAEMLRRQKGGAAVVMGALSPRTRNAQVAMYQSGEVDYLVATDAIGMGLNMDIAHVAFAALGKFDGKRQRRLTLAEMAQIAGRAGRHQKDGSFGAVQLGAEAHCQFTPEEIEGLEAHRFEPLTQLVWRNSELDFSSLQRLVATLDARPERPELVRSDDAIDLAVLKRLAGEPWVMERARSRLLGERGLNRLWQACGLPDYRKTGAEAHARLVGRVFRHLTEGNGRLPEAWIAAEIAHLDRVTGDVEAISDRIAAARTWTYVAHRPDWLEDGAAWAERTRALEERLSDALHAALTQRFVDRRTAVLLKDLKARGADAAVIVEADGVVCVDGEAIGRLDGFRFTADAAARAGEQRLLLAAAERHLTRELAARAKALAAA